MEVSHEQHLQKYDSNYKKVILSVIAGVWRTWQRLVSPYLLNAVI